MVDRGTHEQQKQRVEELEQEVLSRKQAESDLELKLEKVRGLYELAVAMTGDHTLDENLQLIVDKSQELLGTDISYIAFQDESRGEFFKHTMAGIQTEAFRTLRLPVDKGLGGLVARERRGVIVEDYFAEKRFDRFVDRIVADEGIVSGMAVPIQMGRRNLGILYVFSRARTKFSPADLDTLFMIGNLAAVEITRRQAEASLRESEERFRFMAETTGDVIYRLKYASMDYDYLSPGIRSLTGYTSEEIRAVGFSRLVMRIDFTDQESVSQDTIIRNRMEGKTREYRADYLIRTKGGELKWLRDHSFPWHDESAELVGSVGILSDITDYKRAEARVRERTAELIESEEKYRSLVENVPLVTYRIRPRGEILFVNQFVEELFGYGPVELLSNPGLWTERLYGDDRARVEDLREKSFREGKEFMAEYRMIHKRGHLVYVMDHAIPFRAPGGEISSVNGIIMDVTGRVRLQEKLIQAEGLKTISEVSARLAHEIRNPLMSAGGFARRLLRSMSPEDPNRGKVEIILKEVGRLEAILCMILNTLQPVKLHLAPVDINRLVTGALEALDSEIKARNVQPHVHMTDGLPELAMDSAQMQRVLDILIRNALHQTDEGSTLSISTLQENGICKLALRYPVRHLSADDVEHFFYPFIASRPTCAVTDLPLAKMVVSKHGGVIDVRLEEPGTLRIEITLPESA